MAWTTSPKVVAGLIGHLGMVDDLQQRSPSSSRRSSRSPRAMASAPRSFLDRVGRDGRAILLDVPGAAVFGSQRRHDLDQPSNVFRRFIGGCYRAFGRAPTLSAGEGRLSTVAPYEIRQQGRTRSPWRAGHAGFGQPATLMRLSPTI
jgi:hypothetical protein